MKTNLKKKVLWIAVSSISLIILLMAAVVIAQSRKRQQEYDAHLTAGDRFLTELDYEQAIVEYTAALEIEPNQKGVRNALERAYLEYARSYLAAYKYDTAIDILQRGIEQLQSEVLQMELDKVKQEMEIRTLMSSAILHVSNAEYAQAISELLKIIEMDSDNPDAYLRLIEAWTGSGDLKNAEEYARIGYEKTADERIKTYLDYLTPVKAFALGVCERAGEENYEAMREFLDKKAIQQWIGDIGKIKETDVYRYSVENDMDYDVVIFVYEDDSYIYYGKYLEGKRVGRGSWYYKWEDGNFGAYTGSWDNDAPNGDGEVYIYGFLEEGRPYSSLRQGKFEDGLMEGEFTFTDDLGDGIDHFMTAYFEKGTPRDRRGEMPGNVFLQGEVIVAYDDSGWFYHSAPSFLWGVPGFSG